MSTKNLVETPTFNKPNHDTSGRFLGRLGSFGRRILLATGITIAAPVAVEFIGSDKDPAVANADSYGIGPCPEGEERYDYTDVNGDGEYTEGVDWAYCRTKQTTTTSTTLPSTSTTKKPGGGSGGGSGTTGTTIETATTTTTLLPETSVEETPETTEECCADSTAPQESVSATTESECADSTDDCSTTSITTEVAVSEDGENKPGGVPLVVLPIVAGAALVAEQGIRKKSIAHKFFAALKRRHQDKKSNKYNPAV